MTTSHEPSSAPIFAFEIGHGVEDGFFGVVAELHQERLDAPGEEQLAEKGFVVGEGVDRHADGAEGGQGVGEEAAAGEDDDAGFAEFLGEDGGRAEHLGLGFLELG